MAKRKAGSGVKKVKKAAKPKSKRGLEKASKEGKSELEALISQLSTAKPIAKEGAKLAKKAGKPMDRIEEGAAESGEGSWPVDALEGITEQPAAKARMTRHSKAMAESGEMAPAAGAVSFEELGPEVAKERISTKPIPKIASGIQGLDDMTDGGFEEKSIILINGDPGAGKTILGLQFLYAGAMRGEAGLYISFGEPREWLYPRMMSFGMNFQELEDKKLLFVIEYQPHEIAKLMQEEGGTIYDIVMAYNVKRIVVDPITPYLVQFENLYDARLALVRLMNVVRKWNATTLLLNEVSARIQPHPTSILTEFLTDGVVNLVHNRTEEGIQLRGVEIWKLCGIAHMEVARPFAFTKRGIVVYPTERLFAKMK